MIQCSLHRCDEAAAATASAPERALSHAGQRQGRCPEGFVYVHRRLQNAALAGILPGKERIVGLRRRCL